MAMVYISPQFSRENGEASSSSSQQQLLSHCHHESELLPRQFRVFLSHSGKQKYFVERLFEELQRVHIHAFFDRDRDSLGPGDMFPERIMQAATRCEVAVLVLSTDFVMSKWPMMELAAFVKSASQHESLTILPLFYELTVEELSEGLKLNRWMREWEKLAAGGGTDWQGKPIDVQEWQHALKAISQWSGLEYFKSPKRQLDYKVEREYIEDIITSICRLTRPDVFFKDSDVQGKHRLCKMIADQFDNIPASSSTSQVAILGMHGMPGCGKSTLCQCLCNAFYTQFSGEVHYLELPSEGTVSTLLEKLKGLLSSLTKWREPHYSASSISTMRQVRSLINGRKLPRKVFLAVDNVWEASKEAAEAILEFQFEAGSKVLFTSRDRGLLESVFRSAHGTAHLIPIPSLNKDEAASILLHSALKPGYVLSAMQQHVVLEIVGLLDLYIHDGNRGQQAIIHHHPLAMKIVGGMLTRYGEDPSFWRGKVDVKKLKGEMMRDESQVIMKLIEMSYLELPDHLKDLFLDVNFVMFRQWQAEVKDVCQSSSILRKRDTETIMFQLQKLMDLSFIGPQSEKLLQIHDLLREFGSKQVSGDSRYLVTTDYGDVPEPVEKRKVERIAVNNGVLERANFEGYTRVAALVLKDCKLLWELNLCGMKSLAILEVEGCSRMQVVRGEQSLLTHSLVKLRWVDNDGNPSRNRGAILDHERWLWMLPGRRNIITRVARFASLQYLTLSSRQVNDLSTLRHCSNLKELRLTIHDKRMPKLGSMSKLELLHLSDDDWDPLGSHESTGRPAGDLDLSGCLSLQNVTIRLCRLPQLKLGSLERLTRCELDNTHGLPLISQFIDFRGCPNLEVVDVINVSPNLSSLGKLQTVYVRYGRIMADEFDLSAAGETLKELSLYRSLASEFPDLSAPSCVEVCPGLRRFPDLSNLTRLISIDLSCASIEEVPGLGQLKSLAYLDLCNCGQLTSLVGLDQLKNLHFLGLRRCRSLNHWPWILQHTSQLTRFYLDECYALSEETLVRWIVSEDMQVSSSASSSRALGMTAAWSLVCRLRAAKEEETLSMRERLAPRLIPHLLRPSSRVNYMDHENHESLNDYLTELLLWLCWVDGQPHEPSVSLLVQHVMTSPPELLDINLEDLYFLRDQNIHLEDRLSLDAPPGACCCLIGALAAVAASNRHSTSLPTLFDRFHLLEYVDVVSYSPPYIAPQLSMICLLHFVLRDPLIISKMGSPNSFRSKIISLTNKMRLVDYPDRSKVPGLEMMGGFNNINFAVNSLHQFDLRILYSGSNYYCFNSRNRRFFIDDDGSIMY